jgi:hypothetical protein
MAINTIGVVLKWGASSGTETQVAGFKIKDYPDLGGAPEMIETTDLEALMQTFILGVQSSGALEFTYNYDKTVFGLVKADARTPLYYSLEFGTAGANLKATWQGSHDTYVVGKGVNDVMEAKLVIAPSTAITIA